MEPLGIAPAPATLGSNQAVNLDIAQAPARRVGVLVLGMHRSGTSAIARMLGLLGCALPRTLMPEYASNPKGHWESQRVADFNDEILTQAGTQWDDWLPVNPRLSETQIWPLLVQRGREVLREEFGDAPLFALKDPRICKLAGFWIEVFLAENVDPAFVLPLRNPMEVARSLAARDGIQEYHSLLIWLRHVLTAEAATRGRPRVFTDFGALMSDWEAVARRLSGELGVVWPRVSALSAAEISQFLTPDLRHHVSEASELGENPAISTWVIQTYEVLLGWTRHGEQSADYKILDEISRTFDEASIAFARPMLNITVADRRAQQAEAERATVSEDRNNIAWRLGEVEADLGSVLGERDGLIVERDRLVDECTTLGEERDKIAWHMGEIEADFSLVRGERDGLIAECERLAHERDGHVGERERNTEERDKLAWHLGEVEADLGSVRGERDGLSAERDKIAWHMGEIEAELAKATAESAATSVRAARLVEDLATAHSAMDALLHRNAVAESTLRQREEEIDQLGTEMRATRVTVDAQAATAAKARDALSALEAAQAATVNRLSRAAVEAQAALHSAVDRALRAEAELKTMHTRLTDRFAETAHLTRLFRESEQNAAEHKEQAEWLRQINASMQTVPQWWAFMPLRWRRQRELRRLQRKGLFNGQAYLARYPDVATTGMDPLRHYILHGLAEGRERSWFEMPKGS